MEDYKKKYEQAFERAKNYHESHTLDVNPQAAMEYVFPELKESEDEKIKKAAIEFVKQNNSFTHCKGVGKDECLAWLEKQGKHANFRNKIQIGDKVTRNEDGVLVNLSQLNRVAEPAEKQRKKKPTDKVEPKFKVGDKIKLAEEPKYPAREIIAIKNDAYCFDKLEQLPFINQDKWELVGQTPADKIEQKPAWSEEDEFICTSLIKQLSLYENLTSFKPEDVVDWLKSLKERLKGE